MSHLKVKTEAKGMKLKQITFINHRNKALGVAFCSSGESGAQLCVKEKAAHGNIVLKLLSPFVKISFGTL